MITFRELVDTAQAKLKKPTNNKALNHHYRQAAQILEIFGEEIGNDVYTKSELMHAIKEVIVGDKIGKLVYVDDLLWELEEGKKSANHRLDN